MSENLRSQFGKLELISQIKSLQARKIVLKEFSNDKRFCKAVRELVRNAINKNVAFTRQERARLIKYKKLFIDLARRKQKNKEKSRRLVYQTGTGVFLPIVVPLVAQLIASLIAKSQRKESSSSSSNSINSNNETHG